MPESKNEVIVYDAYLTHTFTKNVRKLEVFFESRGLKPATTDGNQVFYEVISVVGVLKDLRLRGLL